MTFSNEAYWRQFCDWVTTLGPGQAQQIMTEYIEENFQHFMQFVENRKWQQENDVTPPSA